MEEGVKESLGIAAIVTFAWWLIYPSHSGPGSIPWFARPKWLGIDMIDNQLAFLAAGFIGVFLLSFALLKVFRRAFGRD